MSSKWNYLKALKQNIEEKEHLYNAAIDNLELVISRINKGIIHGRKEQASINEVTPCIRELLHADFELQRACWIKEQFLKEGIVK